MSEKPSEYKVGTTHAERAAQRRAIALAHSQQAPAAFLAAWKRAVTKIGEHYFNVTAPSVSEAKNIDELRPDFDTFKRNMGVASHGEAIVLANLFTFYNSRDGQTLLDQLPDLKQAVDQFRMIDLEWKKILAELLINDGGW